MPPKKASMPLAGYTVATSGTFAGTTRAAVQTKITTLGAIAKSITKDTNVLLSTPADVKKDSKKVQDAQSNDIPIVSIDWLEHCLTQHKAVDTNLYLLTASASASASLPPAVIDKGKKRVASPALAPAPKAAKFNPLATAPKLEPKVGEGSILKSRDINIPLDEGCPLQTYRVYVDSDGIVYDALLNQTNASNNNNKFYRIQVSHPHL
jgi:poly [ADP-ribose] polymerase